MAKQELGGNRYWYAVHTYSGYENAVLRNLKQKIITNDLQDKIFDVIVPVEKKIKVKGSKRVEVEEKIYPGYVLVDMIVDDDSWYQIRNTPRVTGFVGSGTTPIPLDKKELDFIFSRMNTIEKTHEISLDKGDIISIIDGPFKDYEGSISEIDKTRGKLKVLVSMFGRETPLELDFLQVKKL